MFIRCENHLVPSAREAQSSCTKVRKSEGVCQVKSLEKKK